MIRAGGWVIYRLAATAAAQIGVHHIALNGAGSHDGYLNDQIVKRARLQAGQHVHLRPAFHLKRAQTVALAQHVIDQRVFLGHRRQIKPPPVMRLNQIERLADAGQHAQRQHVDFQNAQLVNIVLVPFDETAVRHRTIADGHGLGQRVFGQDKTADVLRQMARHADHLIRQLYGARHQGIGQVKASLSRLFRAHLTPPTAPDGFRQCRRYVFRKAHHLAHLTDRHPGAKVDDGGTQTRTVAAIFGIDVLDHLFAAFVFEIDVNIRGFFAFLADKAFKQQVMF